MRGEGREGPLASPGGLLPQRGAVHTLTVWVRGRPAVLGRCLHSGTDPHPGVPGAQWQDWGLWEGLSEQAGC